MASNPYAHHLGTQDARAVLPATPGLVHQALCAMSPEQVEAPVAPGKWSPREIVAHLADCEQVFSFRLRQTLAEPAPGKHTVQPFDQDRWAARYAAYDLPSALALLRAARDWNVKLVGSLSEADLAREMHHPERGPLTFQSLLQLMAGHDLNHLAQLQHVCAARAADGEDNSA